MSAEYRLRMWFVIVHCAVAAPLWGWLYVTHDFWAYGLLMVGHTVLLGMAIGVLLGERLGAEE